MVFSLGNLSLARRACSAKRMTGCYVTFRAAVLGSDVCGAWTAGSRNHSPRHSWCRCELNCARLQPIPPYQQLYYSTTEGLSWSLSPSINIYTLINAGTHAAGRSGACAVVPVRIPDGLLATAQNHASRAAGLAQQQRRAGCRGTLSDRYGRYILATCGLRRRILFLSIACWRHRKTATWAAACQPYRCFSAVLVRDISRFR